MQGQTDQHVNQPAGQWGPWDRSTWGLGLPWKSLLFNAPKAQVPASPSKEPTALRYPCPSAVPALWLLGHGEGPHAGVDPPKARFELTMNIHQAHECVLYFILFIY